MKTKFIQHIQCLFFKQVFEGHYLHLQVYTINYDLKNDCKIFLYFPNCYY